MSNFVDGQLTRAGRILHAKAETGVPLRLTRFKIGSGNVESSEIDDMLDLKEPRMDMGIVSNSVTDGICRVSCTLTTKGLEEGFYAKELGLFAMDPDDGEILYLLFTTDTPDMIPPESIGATLTVEYNVNIVVSNMDKLAVDIDPHGLVTVSQANSIARVLQRDTYYKLGDLLYDGRLRAGFFLKCLKSGRSGQKNCCLNKVTLNDTVEDGEVIWQVCKMAVLEGDAFKAVDGGLIAGKLARKSDFGRFIQRSDGSIIPAPLEFSTARIMLDDDGNMIVSKMPVQADDDSDDNVNPAEGVEIATNADMDRLAEKFDF